MKCDLIPVRDEARLTLYLQRQILHQLLVELDDRAALPATRVVVHPLSSELVQKITSQGIRFSGSVGTAILLLTSTKSDGCQTREQLEAI